MHATTTIKVAAVRLSPWGRGLFAMTYVRATGAHRLARQQWRGRKSFGEQGEGQLPSSRVEGPLIRPIVPEARLRHDGAPSPQGEMGLAGLAQRGKRNNHSRPATRLNRIAE